MLTEGGLDVPMTAAVYRWREGLQSRDSSVLACHTSCVCVCVCECVSVSVSVYVLECVCVFGVKKNYKSNNRERGEHQVTAKHHDIEGTVTDKCMLIVI